MGQCTLNIFIFSGLVLCFSYTFFVSQRLERAIELMKSLSGLLREIGPFLDDINGRVMAVEKYLEDSCQKK
jgi:hypothetical protein